MIQTQPVASLGMEFIWLKSKSLIYLILWMILKIGQINHPTNVHF